MLIARPDMGGFVSLTPTIWMATCPTFEFTHSHFQRPHPVIWFFWMGNKSLVLAIGLQRISDSDLNERISLISSLVCSGTLPQIRPNPLHLTFSLLIKSRRKTFLFILRSAYRWLVWSSQNSVSVLMPDWLRYLRAWHLKDLTNAGKLNFCTLGGENSVEWQRM